MQLRCHYFFSQMFVFVFETRLVFKLVFIYSSTQQKHRLTGTLELTYIVSQTPFTFTHKKWFFRLFILLFLLHISTCFQYTQPFGCDEVSDKIYFQLHCILQTFVMSCTAAMLPSLLSASQQKSFMHCILQMLFSWFAHLNTSSFRTFSVVF